VGVNINAQLKTQAHRVRHIKSHVHKLKSTQLLAVPSPLTSNATIILTGQTPQHIHLLASSINAVGCKGQPTRQPTFGCSQPNIWLYSSNTLSRVVSTSGTCRNHTRAALHCLCSVSHCLAPQISCSTINSPQTLISGIHYHLWPAQTTVSRPTQGLVLTQRIPLVISTLVAYSHLLPHRHSSPQPPAPRPHPQPGPPNPAAVKIRP
jgi:hypothetical protein